MGFNIDYENIIGEPQSAFTTMHPMISLFYTYTPEQGYTLLNGLLYTGEDLNSILNFLNKLILIISILIFIFLIKIIKYKIYK